MVGFPGIPADRARIGLFRPDFLGIAGPFRRPDSLGPHMRSIGLDAQSTLYDQLQGFCAEVQAKLVGGNAAAVFNLN